MDQMSENKNTVNIQKNDAEKNEQKIRHNRRNHNNDLWIHVDAHNSETNKFMTLLTGISTLAAISLVVVSLVQHNQTLMLTKQNETLIAQYGQAVTQMNSNYTKTLEELEASLDSISNSINNITISIPNNGDVAVGETTDPPSAPIDDSAFMGVVVMNDGTAVTPLGLRIAGIYDHSPAANAGLRAGDIIMTIEGVSITDFETMSAIIDTKMPGDVIALRFARAQDGTVFFHDATLTLDSASNYDLDLSEDVTQP